MKPCRRCGGAKAPGWNGVYCPACSATAREEAKDKHAERMRERRNGGRVPVGYFREVFEVSSMTKTDLAHALGWYGGRYPSGTPKPDTARVSRAVGMNGQRAVNRTTALRVGSALGLDPVDFGV